MSFKTPILFLIFNRPELTLQVFEVIRKQKPKYFFVAADGARPDVLEDIEKCKATRDIVLNGIDWDCEVKTLFRSENLGCGRAVSQAITWFFDNVEQGIILEDDCLPNNSFFVFCETLLEKYKENEEVFGISGNNFQNGILRGQASYFFSNYSHIWGWATWARAWKHYDFDLGELEEFKLQKRIKKIEKRTVFESYWMSIFDKVYHKEIDTWDYQWQFSLWNNEGLFIVPNVNLISNIGFGKDATHTTTSSLFANLMTNEINSITHPKKVRVISKSDLYVSETVFKIKKNKKLIFGDIKGVLYKKLIKSFPPEIIHLLRRKLKKNQKNKENDLINFPRYNKTNADLLGQKIVIPDSASFVFMQKEIFKEEIYRFKTSNPTPYIIDGGANIGLATIYFKFLYPSSEIIAFEPDFEIFNILQTNIKIYNFTNIELIQKGLWNDSTTLLFKSEGADAGIIADVDKTVTATAKIEVISLKPYLNKPVDLLKLDIEGAETIVLKDIEQDLDKVQRIFIEYHSFVNQPQSLNEIVNILTNAKFRLYMSIPGNNSLSSPLMGLGNYNNMDFQLNIFGYKEGL